MADRHTATSEERRHPAEDNARYTVAGHTKTLVDDVLALLAQARSVAERAYAPYSHFRVGAALTDAAGRVHVGCNVESASYGLTICAERNAIFAAIALGAVRPFSALAVVCLDGACTPCGACRQIMHEHLAATAVVAIDGLGQFSPAQLLPMAFSMPPGRP